MRTKRNRRRSRRARSAREERVCAKSVRNGQGSCVCASTSLAATLSTNGAYLGLFFPSFTLSVTAAGGEVEGRTQCMILT